jgi:hypothetical protein
MQGFRFVSTPYLTEFCGFAGNEPRQKPALIGNIGFPTAGDLCRAIPPGKRAKGSDKPKMTTIQRERQTDF